ncbi:hypothetical protein HRG84_13125 [Flavisolibacter sp. BT320]|nr:hypothetical protein [Flavisolibacter longurius]
MYRYVKLFVFTFCFAACGHPASNKTAATDTLQPPSAIAKANTDTLVIRTTAAVFTEPDSIQLATRKQAVGEETFYAGADDYIFYLNEVHTFLDSTNLKRIVAKNKKYLLFIGNNNTKQLIRLDSLPELWNVYFFHPEKDAKQVDITSIAEEYKNYFH